MTSTDRMTRVSHDLYADAERMAKRQNRSARQQLEYWAWVGRSLTGESERSLSRIQRALQGTMPAEILSVEESKVFDAEVDAAMRESMANDDLTLPENRSNDPIGKAMTTQDGRVILASPNGRIFDAGAETVSE